MFQLSPAILPVILPFVPLFTRPTWEHLQVLLTGTLLCQGPRTVAAALRVMGLGAGEAIRAISPRLESGALVGLARRADPAGAADRAAPAKLADHHRDR